MARAVSEVRGARGRRREAAAAGPLRRETSSRRSRSAAVRGCSTHAVRTTQQSCTPRESSPTRTLPRWAPLPTHRRSQPTAASNPPPPPTASHHFLAVPLAPPTIPLTLGPSPTHTHHCRAPHPYSPSPSPPSPPPPPGLERLAAAEAVVVHDSLDHSRAVRGALLHGGGCMAMVAGLCRGVAL